MGMEGCIRRGRESVFWPGMRAAIQDYVSKCETCQRYSRKQQRETLRPTDCAARPWSVVGVDLFYMAGTNFMVVVDYYSNFPEIDKLQDTSTLTVIQCLKRQFARHGVPEIVRSDNGPQFASFAFQKFAAEWQFEHTTSSPYFPQSNGKAENAVKTAKQLMMKAKESGTDPLLALLAFRNTPTEGFDTSPAQRLMGRRTRTTVPIHHKLLEPEKVDGVMHQLKRQKERQAMYYDRSAQDMPELEVGDHVWVQPNDGPQWSEKRVIEYLGNRSYRLEDAEGACTRRNRRHLRKVPGPGTNNGVEQDCERTSINTAPTDPKPHIEQEEGEGESKHEEEGKDQSQNTREQRTRIGRRVRLPSRYNDYDLS